MKFSVRSIARAAVIAAIYMLTTFLLWEFSHLAIQVRVSEALTLLPMLTLDAVPGLFIGCLLANLMGGAVWFDVVFGALATLLAALCTYRLRKAQTWVGAIPPVLCNGLIVGVVVYLEYIKAPGASPDLLTMLSTMGTVALGEAISCFAIGLPIMYALKKLPKSFWN